MRPSISRFLHASIACALIFFITSGTTEPANAGAISALRALAREARVANMMARLERITKLASIGTGLTFQLTADFAHAVPVISRDDEGWLVTSNFVGNGIRRPIVFDAGQSAPNPVDAWLNVKFQDDTSKLDQLTDKQKQTEIDDYANHAVILVDQDAFSSSMPENIKEAYALASKVLVNCTDGKLRELGHYRGGVSGQTRLVIFYDASGQNVAAPAYDSSMPAAFAELKRLPSRSQNINVMSFYDSPATRAELAKFKNGVLFDASSTNPIETLRRQLAPYRNQVVFALFHNNDGFIALNESVGAGMRSRTMTLRDLEEVAHSCCNVTIFPLTCKAASYSRLIGFSEDLDAPMMLQRLKDASSATSQAEFLSKLSSKDAILVVVAHDFVRQGQVVADIIVFDRRARGMVIIGTVALGTGTSYYLYSS